MIYAICLSYINFEKDLSQLYNCYSKNSSLILDKDKRTFILTLNSVMNINCLEFNKDAQFNLTLGVLNTTLSVLTTDYNYLQSVTQIVFKIPAEYKLNTYNEDHFALATVYNLQYKTEIHIDVYDELKTDLQSCFDLIEVLIVGNYTTFNMCPNQNCVNQLIWNITAKSYIEQISITIDKFTYNLSTINLLEAYQNQLCYSEDIQISNTERSTILLVSFILSKLNVLFVQGDTSMSLLYPLKTNINDISNVFLTKYSYMYNYYNDTGYEIIFEYDQPKLEAATQFINSLNYDLIVYKLAGSIRTNGGVQSLSLTKTGTEFVKNQRSIVFSCSEMKGEQQKTCLQMLYNDYNEYSAISTYNLDIMFYNQGNLVYLIKAYKCRPIYTCWKYGVVILTQQQLQIQLTRNGYCDNYHDYYDYSNISIQINVYNENYELQQQFQNYYPIVNATNISCFNYSLNQIDISKINKNTKLRLEMNVSTFSEQFYINKVIDLRQTNRITKGLHIFGSILMTIFAIILLLKAHASKQQILIYQHSYNQRKYQQSQIIEIQQKVSLGKQE
ncbi:Conserved_hypothetical protein [Hexamita inflata]|uniref:Transmembrane protein n=1 Tax=Hexamita inflata TaxID=28002 RepID=A0AA86VIW7_9EUKA|nr:Conserved hypothetical protein [Hexamita inflata]